MKIGTLISKMKSQLNQFLGNVEICKPCRRFIRDMVYGILAHKSVHLSEIGRALLEPIRLVKTVTRLSRQLNRKGLWEVLTRFTLHEAKARIGERTLLILDLSDIAKPKAKKMENLAEVWDGSKGITGLGYWLLQIVAVSCGKMDLIPLLNYLWSQNAVGHLSENAVILQCMGLVRQIIGPKGIWVIDRGADRKNLFLPMLEQGLSFLVRLVGNRNLVYQGETTLASDLAKRCNLRYHKTVEQLDKNRRIKHLRLEYGFIKVRLPGSPADLYLIVIDGFGDERAMLLTNVSIRELAGDVGWLVDAYTTRWRVEDLLRFLKQEYQLEDIRLLGYHRLQNMMALLMLVAYFNMVILEQELRLKVCRAGVMDLAQRLFGIGALAAYALADGMSELFSKTRTRPFPRKKKPPKNPIQTTFLPKLKV